MKTAPRLPAIEKYMRVLLGRVASVNLDSLGTMNSNNSAQYSIEYCFEILSY